MSAISTASRRRSGSATRFASCRRWPAARTRADMALPKPAIVRHLERDYPDDRDQAQVDGQAHRRAHDALTPHGGRYCYILDSIGQPTLVVIHRMSPIPN